MAEAGLVPPADVLSLGRSIVTRLPFFGDLGEFPRHCFWLLLNKSPCRPC